MRLCIYMHGGYCWPMNVYIRPNDQKLNFSLHYTSSSCYVHVGTAIQPPDRVELAPRSGDSVTGTDLGVAVAILLLVIAVLILVIFCWQSILLKRCAPSNRIWGKLSRLCTILYIMSDGIWSHFENLITYQGFI